MARPQDRAEYTYFKKKIDSGLEHTHAALFYTNDPNVASTTLDTSGEDSVFDSGESGGESSKQRSRPRTKTAGSIRSMSSSRSRLAETRPDLQDRIYRSIGRVANDIKRANTPTKQGEMEANDYETAGDEEMNAYSTERDGQRRQTARDRRDRQESEGDVSDRKTTRDILELPQTNQAEPHESGSDVTINGIPDLSYHGSNDKKKGRSDPTSADAPELDVGAEDDPTEHQLVTSGPIDTINVRTHDDKDFWDRIESRSHLPPIAHVGRVDISGLPSVSPVPAGWDYGGVTFPKSTGDTPEQTPPRQERVSKSRKKSKRSGRKKTGGRRSKKSSKKSARSKKSEREKVDSPGDRRLSTALDSYRMAELEMERREGRAPSPPEPLSRSLVTKRQAKRKAKVVAVKKANANTIATLTGLVNIPPSLVKRYTRSIVAQKTRLAKEGVFWLAVLVEAFTFKLVNDSAMEARGYDRAGTLKRMDLAILEGVFEWDSELDLLKHMIQHPPNNINKQQ